MFFQTTLRTLSIIQAQMHTQSIRRNGIERIAMSRAIKWTTVIAVVFLVVLLCSVLLSCNSLINKKPQSNSLQDQEVQISVALSLAGHSFSNEIALKEQEDARGKYYVGVISEKLDSVLSSLVEAYNADVITTVSITEEDLRYSLTEGLVEATSNSNTNSSFMCFLRWAGTPADLVYAGDMPSAGIIGGTEVPSNSTTNYEYFSDPDSFPIYTHRIDYEAVCSLSGKKAIEEG